MKELNKLWKFLGFNYKYNTEFLTDAIMKDGYISYEVKIIDVKLYWFNIKIKDIKC
jgi:hypothetical protein